MPATHKIEPPSNFHDQHKLSAAPTGFGWAAAAASAVSGDVDAAQQLVAQLLSELMACTLALVEALNPLEWSAVSVEKSNTGTGAVSGTPRLPPSPSSSYPQHSHHPRRDRRLTTKASAAVAAAVAAEIARARGP